MRAEVNLNANPMYRLVLKYLPTMVHKMLRGGKFGDFINFKDNLIKDAETFI